jgi:hypothetical protein
LILRLFVEHLGYGYTDYIRSSLKKLQVIFEKIISSYGFSKRAEYFFFKVLGSHGLILFHEVFLL